MTSNINLNVVGTGNFTSLEAAVQRLKTSVTGLQTAMAGDIAGFNREVTQQIAGMNKLIQATNAYKIHTTQMSTVAEQLSQRIAKNKITFADFAGALKSVNAQNSTFLELGKKQIAMQKALALNVGGTVHVYEQLNYHLDGVKARSLAAAQGIAAQNAVLKEAAVKIVNFGKNAQWTGRQLTMGITMPLVMFGSQAAKIFNEVDKNMTKLAKVYGVGLTEPTKAQLEMIRKDVMALSDELARSLGISATEVTDIAQQFAAAGLQSEQLISATKQAARMVVLGEADKQEAITATISLQTAYKLQTEELTEAVNFFNAAQAATSTSMADLINAVPRVGPIIQGLGGTYKDMVAILTALKEGGVPAGEAANAIKNSLGRIISPTKAAREELMKFGIDLEGIVNRNAGNLTGTLTELQAGLLKLDGLSRQKAISELFGKYQFARMSAFIENFGQVGTQSQKVMEMMGLSAAQLGDIADKQTKKIQESASGRFKIAIETLKNQLVPVGEAFLDIFTKVAEKVSELITKFEELPGPVKTMLKAIAGVSAIVGPIVMVGGLIGNMLGSIALGLVNLKKIGGATRSIFGGGGLESFRTIIGGFKQITPESIAAKNAVQMFADSENNASKSAEKLISALMIQAERFDILAGSAQRASVNVNSATDAVARNTAAAEQTVPAGKRVVNPGAAVQTATTYIGSSSSVAKKAGVLQAALENTPYFFRQEGESSRQTYMRIAEAGGVTISPQVQEALKSTAALDKIIVTRSQYVQSTASYFAKLEAFLKGDMKQWGAEISALKTKLKSAQGPAQRKVLFNEFISNLNISEQELQQLIQTHTDSLETIIKNENLTDQELRNRVGQMEVDYRNRLMALKAPNVLSYSSRESSRDVMSLLYLLSGAGRGTDESVLSELMSSAVPGSKGALRGFERSHMTPEAMVALGIPILSASQTRGAVPLSAPAQNVMSQSELEKFFVGLPGHGDGGGVPLDEKSMTKREILKANVGKYAGTAGLIGSSAMMMGGIGNQTVNNAMMGISMASMVPGGLAIKAAVAAIPLLIQGYQALAEKADMIRKANQNAFSVSTREAEIFGIKIAKLGETTLPIFTEEQKKVADAVSSFTDQIKQLDKSDPLAAFVESLSGKKAQDQIKAIQDKYMTLRIAGVNDTEAKNMVRAIMRAAGIEQKAGVGVFSSLPEYSNMTQAEIFAAQQSRIASGLARYTTTATGGTMFAEYSVANEKGASLEYNAQITAEGARTLYDIITKQGFAGVKMISDYSDGLKRGSAELTQFNRNVNKLMRESGMTAEQMIALKKSGGTTADMLDILTLTQRGVITSADMLANALENAAYRESLINRQRVTEANTALSSDLGSVLSRTSYTTGGNQTSTSTQQQNVADKAIAAQKAVVDKLQKELDLRKKILDAQNKSVDFQMSQADLQQKYNEALASGNVGEAMQIQRQMEMAQTRYGQDLETTAMEDRLQKEKDALQSLEEKKSKLAETTSAKVVKTTTITVEQVNEKYKAMIADILSKGGDVTGTINTWANELKTKFGGNIDEIKAKLGTFASSLSAAGFKEYADAAVRSLDSVLGKQTAINIASRASKLIVSSNISIPDAYVQATKEMAGSGYDVSFNKKKNAVAIAPKGQMTGRPSYFELSTIAPTNTNTYRRASGGYISGPGTAISDSIPAMLSNGEYVVRASAVKAVGLPILESINRMSMGGYVQKAAFRAGGYVHAPRMNLANGGYANNASSLYNDHSQINVYVSQTNASANDIANAVYGAIQKRENMAGSRTVIRT